MAIDTRDRRTAAMNHKCPWRRHRPLADGTIGTADRKHLARLYSGIATSAVADPSYGCAHALSLYQPGAQAAAVYQPGAQALDLVCQC